METHILKVKQKLPFTIGLTGGFGAGKSLVLKFLRKKGIPVFQTDKAGHDLLREPSVAESVVRKFGKFILSGRGRIDRKKLAQEAFRNVRNQKIINNILHSLIRNRVKQWVESQAQKLPPPSIAVVEVPLLFEIGYDRWFDKTLCVSTSQATRFKRLLKLGWTLSEIKKREKLQWPQKRKDQKADWVIYNNGSSKDLRYTVQKWLQKK